MAIPAAEKNLSPIARLVRKFYAGGAQRPVVSHGPLSRLGDLSRDTRLQDVRAIVDAVPIVNFSPSFSTVVPSEVEYGGGIPIAKSAAYPLFHSGNTLIVKSLLPEFPALAATWREISNVFGLTPRPGIFMSPRKVGTPTHFDISAVLVIQVGGAKRWWISENRDVAAPITWDSHYVYGPRPKRSIVLREGSVLLLPAGWWHATDGVEDSISVSTFLDLPSWLDVAQRALIDAAPAAWAEPAMSRVVGGAAGTREVRERVSALLREAAERLSSVGNAAPTNGAHVARRAPLAVPTRLVRVPGTPARLRTKRGYFITGDVVVGSPRKATIPISPELWELTRTILVATAPLDVRELRNRVGRNVSADVFADLVVALIRSRVVRAAPARDAS